MTNKVVIVNNLNIFDRIAALPFDSDHYATRISVLMNVYKTPANSRLNLIKELTKLLRFNPKFGETINYLASSNESDLISLDCTVNLITIIAYANKKRIKLDSSIIIPALIELVDPSIAWNIPMRIFILMLYDLNTAFTVGLGCMNMIESLSLLKSVIWKISKSKNNYDTIMDNISKYLLDDETSSLINAISEIPQAPIIKWVDDWLEHNQMNRFDGFNNIEAIKEYSSQFMTP